MENSWKSHGGLGGSVNITKLSGVGVDSVGVAEHDRESENHT